MSPGEPTPSRAYATPRVRLTIRGAPRRNVPIARLPADRRAIAGTKRGLDRLPPFGPGWRRSARVVDKRPRPAGRSRGLFQAPRALRRVFPANKGSVRVAAGLRDLSDIPLQGLLELPPLRSAWHPRARPKRASTATARATDLASAPDRAPPQPCGVVRARGRSVRSAVPKARRSPISPDRSSRGALRAESLR